MDEVCKVCGSDDGVRIMPIFGQIGRHQTLIPQGKIEAQPVGLPLCVEHQKDLDMCIGARLQQRKAEAAQDLEIACHPDGINPTWDGEIPLCGEKACRFYADIDSGRCNATGKALCEDGHCESAVIRMARALRPFAEFARTEPCLAEGQPTCTGGIYLVPFTAWRAAAESLPKVVA